ncbi:DUF3221 domain-containing protein [Bacillus cereus]|uniref:DUF3221 domain-containing protein n=1 Tax=Bacillus cereus TaxID=1396 RepID=A0A9X7CNU8_BACCE|nr:DUF3221 domain-containing protein [Bacillus cereus]PGS79424.1 DUF3221 domain-containing protein [Bacillus cereus]
MKALQSKVMITAASLTLGGSFLLGGVPASADIASPSTAAVSTMNSMEETPYLTGYIVSINDNYLTVIDAPTREEALLLQKDLYAEALQHKILLVPINKDMNFAVGNKVSVFTKAVTSSIPAQAIAPTIQKIMD